ncbi:divalent metal cation transporter [Blastococcus sp. MG754426]|uniref:Nramp family divalent metal transporter n=1 Tax=unclassified Blastococcus TaxID=2619396 RepID=UPI001EF10474|nr:MULTISPECIES: Nramp family divalent metal transporter [unclassified Blastococcus]MCF6509318.1 divalent metal cation transporter [Blastococcus sp. MG754426]MCF6513397.1 divalent metal cation transporter [Blastococcus sp. MG754427]MCF6736682.1 divalent metal cation transporter [Blastococcus sp. KM273129]
MYLSKTEAAVLPTTLRAPAQRPASTAPGRRRLWSMLGPAFVAAVAYVDPGNFATNFSGGAAFGYTLLWVIVAANLMAMLIQSLTAKLGLATGRDLATLCRENLPRPVTRGLWLQAEAVAIATDLAEIVGGAVALYLLFGVPLPIGGVITAVVAFVLLAAQSRGYRPFERVIAGLLLVIGVGFGYTLLGSGVDPGGLAGGMVPSFDGAESLVLATGILGATVMPHVIYVHSALTPGRYGDAVTAGRTREGRGRLLRAQRIDIVVAMGLAGLVNAAMLVIAAQLFTSDSGVDTLEGVHTGLGDQLGTGAALAFALALLASGFASSSVGTHAGQVVMAGFLKRHIPVLTRRLITLAPALAVLVLGGDPTTALVWSQVVLSFGIPFALVPLLWLTSRRDLMGGWVNRRTTTVAGSVVAALIIGLNAHLLLGFVL